MTFLIQLLVLLSPIGLSCASPPVVKEEIEVVDFAGLEEYLAQFEDKILVVNFWATWCVPCVKELPYFEQAVNKYENDNVVVVLVSLDFADQVNKRVKPFVKKHQLKSRVIVLDDPDQNVWIDKVDPRWSGAIPFTMVKKGDRKEVHEKMFQSFDELDTIIQSLLNS